MDIKKQLIDEIDQLFMDCGIGNEANFAFNDGLQAAQNIINKHLADHTIVPDEPNEAMCKIGWLSNNETLELYKAMLQAYREES